MPVKSKLPFRPLLCALLALCGVLLIAAYFLQPVTILVNGSPRQVRTAGLTVAAALRAARIPLAPEDRLFPPAASWIPASGVIRLEQARPVSIWNQGKAITFVTPERIPGNLLMRAAVRVYPGDQVLVNGHAVSAIQPLEGSQPLYLQVQPAHPLRVLENGAARTVNSSAATLGAALWEAGLQPLSGDRVSLPLETPLRDGLRVEITRAKPLVIQLKGVELHSRSAAASVGQALAESGIALQGLDYSSPGESQPLPADGRIRVVRVDEQVLLAQKTIPFKTTYQPDANVDLDQRRVTTPGRYGVIVSRVRVRYEDGKEVRRAAEAEWTASQPQDQVVGLGTKITVQSTNTPDGTIEYWRAVKVYATSYSPCQSGRPGCSLSTSSGTPLRKGIVAVTLPWYRLMAGQRVYIPGYGFAVIADVGGGIPGTYWVDLGYSEGDYQTWHQTVTMYFLTPAPASAPPVLP